MRLGRKEIKQPCACEDWAPCQQCGAVYRKSALNEVQVVFKSFRDADTGRIELYCNEHMLPYTKSVYSSYGDVFYYKTDVEVSREGKLLK